MVKYIIKRLLLLVPVLIGVSILVFFIMHLLPSDPAATILGEHATTSEIAKLRESLGLNKPIIVQYWDFLCGLFKGNLGNSLFTKTPVLDELRARFPATFELALSSIVLAAVFGILMGIIAAIKQNSILDYLSMIISLLGVSMPIFWLGLILILVFGVQLHWLPVSGRITIGLEPDKITGFYLLDSLLKGNMEAFKSSLMHLILPSIALASYSTAIIARMTRSTMLEVIRQDYVRTARSKGLSEKSVIFGHALKNAMIPVVTVIGLQFGSLLGGAVLTETIFSWPGVGSYLIDAVLKLDYPIVQGAVMMVATTFVLINLIVDIIYAFIDPRIKYS